MSEITVTDLKISEQGLSLKLSESEVIEDSYSETKYIKLQEYKIRFGLHRRAGETPYATCEVKGHDCLRDHVKINIPTFKTIVVIDYPNTSTILCSLEKTINVLEVKAFITSCQYSQSKRPFKPLHEDETLVDFKIGVKEPTEGTVQESVGFHRAVLSLWSPVMMKMFSNSWKEKNEGVLKLPVTLEVIRALKKYVYTDELPTDRETLLGLAELGSYYMDTKLEIRASNALSEITSTNEVMETLVYSYQKKLLKLAKIMLIRIGTIACVDLDNLDQLLESELTKDVPLDI